MRKRKEQRAKVKVMGEHSGHNLRVRSDGDLVEIFCDTCNTVAASWIRPKGNPAYFASKLTAGSLKEMKENSEAAASLAEQLKDAEPVEPVAPHADMFGAFDDRIESDRTVLMEFCREVLSRCNSIYVHTPDIHTSAGVREEMNFAKNNGIPLIGVSSSRGTLKLGYTGVLASHGFV